MPAGPSVLRFSRGLPPSRQFGERLRLLVIQGENKGTCFSLLGDLLFLGREGCQIVLQDPNISKKHVEIGWKGDHYVARDLGSANGIVYNGAKVMEAHLQPGGLLLVGLTMLEVYPPGQTKKTERPLLPENSSGRPLLVGAATKNVNQATPLNAEEIKKKRETEKKRLVIYALLFFLAFILYFSESDSTTIRENARLPKGEEETQQDTKKKSKKEVEAALSEYIPNYTLDTQQRKDAEIFFRTGVRELQNKNFRRAFTAFETALTVDPTHELAKIYLKSAKKEMLAELQNMSASALRAKRSLRYKEARMHYGNIIRYLEGEAGNNNYMDNESNSMIKKMFEETQQAIKELDKEENKIQ